MAGNETELQDKMQEQQRQAAQQIGSGLLSWLNPFNYGIFTWLIVGVLGFVGYNALSDNKEGGGFLSKFFDMLPEGVQKWAAETFSGVDGDAAMALRKIAQRHGKDGLTDSDYLEPKILYDAMLEQPKALIAVTKDLPKGGQMDEKGRQALAAVRQIVNDPAKLATLLDATHKADTYALLESLSPITFKGGALGTFIDATAMRNGKVDPAFVQLLNTMLVEGSLTDRIKPQEIATFFSRPGNAAAFGTLLASVDDTKLTPKMREAVTALRQNWGNKDEGLAEVVADKDSLAFLLAMGTTPPTTKDKLIGMVPDSIKSTLGKVMPEGVLPAKIGENVAQLLTVQAAFKEAGVEMGGSTAAAPKRPVGSAAVAH